MFRDLDKDTSDYLNYNAIINDIQTAFTGGSGSSRLPLKEASFTANEEEPKGGKDSALVLYSEGGNPSKRNQLLKERVKMITQAQKGTASFIEETPHEPGDENDPTFLTAAHMTEKERVEEVERQLVVAHMRPKKYYSNPGEEALDELEAHERDMNEMMKYLCEVQEMFRKGEDLKEISSMIDVTRENLDQHYSTLTKL